MTALRLNPLFRAARRFAGDRRGNVASIFALATLPALAAFGSAVDYGRASHGRTQIQAALDATALALAKEAGTKTAAQLQSMGQFYFEASYKAPPAMKLAPIVVTKTDKIVRVQASGVMKTAVMQVLQKPEIEVAAISEAAWGNKKIELALVLDNTGSMGWGGKMEAMKAASLELIATLESASKSAGAGSVKISIVPFDADVRVGTTYANANWMAFDPANPNPDLRADPKTPALGWTGCVTDRTQARNLDASSVAPKTWDAETLFLGVNCRWGAKLTPIRRLTDNFADLRATVKAMKPSGCTNVTIGSTWGLKTLSPEGPFSDGSAWKTKNVEKIMILLTDGLNTQNREVNACSGSGSSAAIDQRTRKACQENAAMGVKVYTIRVIEGSVPLLKDCAVNGGSYNDVQKVDQLKAVFKQIADEILAIRLTV